MGKLVEMETTADKAKEFWQIVLLHGSSEYGKSEQKKESR